ncbi:pyridoxal phosphate-dependent aminotransferase [Paenibacillus shenyangensis]|uniref:pyridoxal phosphate-dependent aminotransferase n=1 Tax=Paenibacillus sp. A9 TaxID=1284352 RepID=UPI000362120F|nr:aminotransferase class I/II-fold pyridoxal phosphate-dependent enzyme [Paenibacillus sp. A9]
MIEVYGHGGDRTTAAEQFGRPIAEMMDYSANMNAAGPPPGLLDYLAECLPQIIHYPDPVHRRLRGLIAERNRCSNEQLVIGNGAAECMALLLLALRPAVVGLVEPCFSEYAQLSSQYGSKIIRIYGRQELDYRADVAEICQLITQVDLLFLGQPNNPNGVQYIREDLKRIADTARTHGVTLVIDEAFTDFIPAGQRVSLQNELEQYPNMIIVRSMTKFYAIPGLRLGYTISSLELAARLRSQQVTWSVNTLAQAAGEWCLEHADDTDYEQQTILHNIERREHLREQLIQMGCKVCAGEANYLLVELPEPWEAETFQMAMGHKGILIRSCSMYPGLGSRHIRVAVKDEKHNAQLLAGWKQIITGQQKGEQQ